MTTTKINDTKLGTMWADQAEAKDIAKVNAEADGQWAYTVVAAPVAGFYRIEIKDEDDEFVSFLGAEAAW